MSHQGRFEGALAFYNTLCTFTQLQNFKPTCKQLVRQDPIYIEFSEQLEKPCKNDLKKTKKQKKKAIISRKLLVVFSPLVTTSC